MMMFHFTSGKRGFEKFDVKDTAEELANDEEQDSQSGKYILHLKCNSSLGFFLLKLVSSMIEQYNCTY